MTAKLDALFSPDRLRQNWQNALVPVTVPAQNKINLTIHSQYLELQRLISEKFSNTSCLSETLNNLTAEIDLAFSLDATALPVDAKQKDTIVGLLEILEELLWAMDLSKQTPL
jgi:hypothetical protein